MKTILPAKRSIVAAIIFAILISPGLYAEALIADHNAVGEFDLIENSYFDLVRAEADIFYMHTSHGQQILEGLAKLTLENTLYSSPTFTEYASDAGADWDPYARDYLDNHPECNMFIISWCGQLSSDLATRVPSYLERMNQMELDYPNVTFIYMTGHLDGTGPDGPLYVNNNLIREYCLNNDKILFDFADIESYDPDGNYYPDGTDACEWCVDWCIAHDCADDCVCAHSHCYNCYVKGKAFWWMIARIWGWDTSAGIDESQSAILPENITLSQNAPNPFNPSTEIRFSLPTRSLVSLQVLNISGQKVGTLAEGEYQAGTHTVIWYPENLASGIYLYRLRSGGFEVTRKMIFLK